MSKTSKLIKQNVGTKGHVTFQGQGHVISRPFIFILVAYDRMHLCSKFDANRTIRLRVIQMAPERDGQTDRQSNRQSNSYTQVITIPSKRLFQRRFAVKSHEGVPVDLKRFRNGSKKDRTGSKLSAGYHTGLIMSLESCS